MIKLIACDLDGTLLLNGAQSLRPETVGLIKELRKQGRVFVPASGRQYPNLRRLFAGVEDEIAYICENGALIMYEGKEIFKYVIEREKGQEIMKRILAKKEAEVLLSGVNTCYIQPKDPAYAHHLKNIVKNNVTIVEDILATDEPYIKISLYEKAGVAENYDYWTEQFKGLTRVVTSGNAWLDTMHEDIHKGSAVREIGKAFGIAATEMMAIGDNYNDLEMLMEVGYAVAMEKAPEAVKKVCPYQTALVEDTLREILEGKYD